MTRDEAIQVLQANREILRTVGVEHAYLFGSIADGRADSDSDVDVMIDVAYEPFTIFKIMRVQDKLEDMMNCRVDVVIRADARESKKLRVAADRAIHVF